VRFATKPQLARQLLERVQQAGLPCAWVVADSVYGNDGDLRLWLVYFPQKNGSPALCLECPELAATTMSAQARTQWRKVAWVGSKSPKGSPLARSSA